LLASAVSARTPVRKFLLELQRRIGQDKAAVFEGRDMGTVVFPGAEVKFYLDASPEVRALRRHREMGDRPPQDLATVEAEIRRRDADDSTRRLAPLKPARDAVRIDSTDLSVEKVVDEMLVFVEQSLKLPRDRG
jgi:cytidylate kinase